jgi:4-hydroxy-4-methyl-2-oxoglutarate aldolase
VLVADAEGFDRAGHWGEVLTVAAMSRGIAGLVIDGSVRDAGPIATRGFPVFHRGLCVVTASKEAPQAPEPTELTIGGCTVRPGDYVVADRDGVVFVEGARIGTVLEQARRRTDEESGVMRALAGGATTLELFGLR